MLSRVAESGVGSSWFARRKRYVGSRPFPDRAPGTDSIPEIGHIVVLMMENHSYDNYLGVLERGDGLEKDDRGDVVDSNMTSQGRKVIAKHMLSTTQHPKVPSQSWAATHEQWAGGRNDGFIRSAEEQGQRVDPRVAMDFWNEDDLPFYYGLARVFPVSDRWFSSCLGPTFPNRRFLISGTANGLISDELSRILDRPENGTIFDLLNNYGISWANYHCVSHGLPIATRVLGIHGLRFGRLIGGLVKPWAAKLRSVTENAKSSLQFTADCYPLGLLGYLGHVKSVDRFISDAREGKLPAVSIVDPDFRHNSEENPQDIQEGEAFAARIINAVMHGAGWSKTLLIWVYDEHGGYYDHVAPPAAPQPDDRLPEDGGMSRFDRYGFRVPAVIVSPFAKANYVSHQVHDHTSILKLIETKWNLPPLTRRDANADNLLDSLDLTRPPSFIVPPELPSPAIQAS